MSNHPEETGTPRRNRLVEVERKTERHAAAWRKFFMNLMGREVSATNGLTRPIPNRLEVDVGGDWIVEEKMETQPDGEANFRILNVNGSIAVIFAESFRHTYVRLDSNLKPIFKNFYFNERHKVPAGTDWRKSIYAEGRTLSPDSRPIKLLHHTYGRTRSSRIAPEIEKRIDERIKAKKTTLSPIVHLFSGGFSIIGFARIPMKPVRSDFDPNFKLGMPPPMDS